MTGRGWLVALAVGVAYWFWRGRATAGGGGATTIPGSVRTSRDFSFGGGAPSATTTTNDIIDSIFRTGPAYNGPVGAEPPPSTGGAKRTPQMRFDTYYDDQGNLIGVTPAPDLDAMFGLAP